MRDNLVYFVFFIYTFLAIHFGDVFGLVLTLAGFFVMMYIIDTVKDNNESLPIKLP